MKFKATLLVLILVTLPGIASSQSSGVTRQDEGSQTEQSTPAQSSVTVTVCTLSGSIDVRGWDKNQVVARSSDGPQIQLRRSEKEPTPASRVDVIVLDNIGSQRTRGRCQSSSAIELNVPRGATVQVQSRDGDINIAQVATAYAGSQNGTISFERITQASEAGSVGGDIYIKDSAGRIDLNTIGGAVEATNVRPADPGDIFEVVTVSGDVELMKIGHSHLNVRTVNGNMKLTGPLQPDGRYGINTMSGDVTFALPADSSFRLNAKVSSGGDIITDFPLMLLSQSVGVARSSASSGQKRAPQAVPPSKVQATQQPSLITPASPPAKLSPVNRSPRSTPAQPDHTPPPSQAPQTPQAVVVKIKPTTAGKKVIAVQPVVVTTLRRVSAICGTGDALISVASFSGTLHLQKN